MHSHRDSEPQDGANRQAAFPGRLRSKWRQARRAAPGVPGVRPSRSTQPGAIFSRPFGSHCGGRLRARAAQPYGPIRFSRPAPVFDSPQRDAGRKEYEKCGLTVDSSAADPAGKR
jgi:hypothetical protein